MSLASGARIGSFEVIGPIGAGGMGEVYRVHDTKLGRDVALKILPDLFVADPERLARFEREARTLAALNHPHVAQIYGVEESGGTRALVMELVPGRTLEEVIRLPNRLPMAEALSVARQIADALEAAHDQNIIHRDLKPANIMVRDDGTVKVLDFGLAKALEINGAGAGGHDLRLSPATMTSPAMTAVGVVLGTAAYMSPEQARGRTVDRRADIWAFGVILFEMLTGKQVFAGDSITDVLAAIVKEEPDWSALPPETPGAIQRLLRRCLEKDPKRRLRDAADARLEIEDALAARPEDRAAASAAPQAVAASTRRRGLLWAASLVAALLIGGVAAWRLKAAPDLPVRRFSIQTPDRQRATEAVISPDGRAVAFATAGRAWVQRLDQAAPQEIPGGAGARILFWSPDGSHIGYQARGHLWKVALAGGSPIDIGSVPSEFGAAGGAAWLANDRIWYTTGGSGLLEVSAQGGNSRALLDPDVSTEIDFHEVSALPDAGGVLFVPHPIARGGNAAIEMFDGRQRQPVFEATGIRQPVYSPTGHILFVRSEGIWAVKFSISDRKTSGEPFLVAGDAARPSISRDGTLVAVPESSSRDLQLTWVDRAGKVVGTVGRGGMAVRWPRLSPDGRQVVATVMGPTADLYIFDIQRGTDRRLTFEPGPDVGGTWSPDGKHILYQCDLAICARPSDGSGERTVLVPAPAAAPELSPDGKHLVFAREQAKTGWDLMIVPLGPSGVVAPPTEAPRPLIAAARAQQRVDISPDGKFLAYESNETGNSEIYITTFPSGEGKWQVSRVGGSPRWSHGGDRIFFLSSDRILEVGVDRVPTPEPGVPKDVLSGPAIGARVTPFGFERSLDGSRFLIPRPSSGDTEVGSVLLVEQWIKAHGR